LKGERDQVLRAVEQGDILFAKANDGSSKLVLVYKATETSISARLITSQTLVEFDRTGQSIHVDGEYTCKIVSASPLPIHEYHVALGLDRKMRLSHWASDVRLSEDEKQLLLTMDEYFATRQLPEE
jgi:hypothetical protein